MHTSSASVTSGGWPRPDPVNPPEVMIWYGQFHIQCGQEGVPVGEHDGLHGLDLCEHADPGHSSLAGQRTPAGVSRHNGLASGESPGR